MLLAVALYDMTPTQRSSAVGRKLTTTLSDERNAYNPLNRQQRLTLTLTLTQMLETLSGDGMSSTLLNVGACATARAAMGGLGTTRRASTPPPRCQYRVCILRWYMALVGARV